MHLRFLHTRTSRQFHCIYYDIISVGDSCQGDSGGPLIIRRRIGPLNPMRTASHVDGKRTEVHQTQERYVLAGIVAGGRGCGRPDSPGIYVDPQKHISWIINTISRN